MRALPCPFCGSDKTEFHNSPADPGLGERYILCESCRATGPLGRDDGQANLKWQALTIEGRLEEIENGIGKELAAYQALSGGMSAMEYALYVADVNKVKAQVAGVVLEAKATVRSMPFPEIRGLVSALERALEIDPNKES